MTRLHGYVDFVISLAVVASGLVSCKQYCDMHQNRVVNDYDSDRDSVSDCWRENDRLTGYRRLPAITYYRAARLE